jgi:arginase family enzyme
VTWAVIGAPLNSSARPGGEELAPTALRRAGLLDRLSADDDGDIAARVGPAERDPASGVLGLPGLLAAGDELRDRVDAVMASARRPLVVGGDCSLLLGVGFALRRCFERPGLWFVDGHTDTYDGASSPTGEAADMELGVLTGRGPAELIPQGGPDGPVIAPERVVALGHRHPDDAEDTSELKLVDPSVTRVDVRRLRAQGAGRTAREAESRLGERTDGVWLHVDLDVLDRAALPAVSYPQSGGLAWEELLDLIAPLAGSRHLIGASVADLNSDLDPAGEHAGRVVDLLASALV